MLLTLHIVQSSPNKHIHFVILLVYMKIFRILKIIRIGDRFYFLLIEELIFKEIWLNEKLIKKRNLLYIVNRVLACIPLTPIPSSVVHMVSELHQE